MLLPAVVDPGGPAGPSCLSLSPGLVPHPLEKLVKDVRVGTGQSLQPE